MTILEGLLTAVTAFFMLFGVILVAGIWNVLANGKYELYKARYQESLERKVRGSKSCS